MGWLILVYLGLEGLDDFVFLVFVFLWATSLGPKPSLFCFFVKLFFLFFAFLSLLLIESPAFPLKKDIFVYFSVSPCVPFSLILASPFFTLSFFVSLLFFSFFLPSCFSWQFLVLAFCLCFVCFFFQDVILVLFFCLLSFLFCFESYY